MGQRAGAGGRIGWPPGVVAAGTSPVVDMVRSLVSEQMLEAVSVGFRPLDMEPLDKKNPFGPQRFKKHELLEAFSCRSPPTRDAVASQKVFAQMTWLTACSACLPRMAFQPSPAPCPASKPKPMERKIRGLVT